MNKVFIIGCPRSGTSLCGRILGACKNTSYWEESTVILNMIRPDGYTSQDDVNVFLKFATIALNTKTVDLPEPKFNLLHSFMEAGLEIDPCFDQFKHLRRKELVWEVLKYFDSLGYKNWIEKTPPHTFHVDEIRKNFPGCHILHVFRHPLDAISSMKEFSLRNGEKWNVEGACKLWNEYFGYSSIKCDFGIKYGDMTFHKLIMKQLVSKLGLQWSDDCDTLYENVRKRTVDAWEKRLTRKELWFAFKYIDWGLAERGGFFPY